MGNIPRTLYRSLLSGKITIKLDELIVITISNEHPHYPAWRKKHWPDLDNDKNIVIHRSWFNKNQEIYKGTLKEYLNRY